MPELYNELDALQNKLEQHYHDMQDMEFTVQEGKLWFLQTRNGKRTGTAMVKIAMDLLHEGMIDEKTAIPLNVSRSYLQSDANVKKISGYITKKVSDRRVRWFRLLPVRSWRILRRESWARSRLAVDRIF